MNNTCSLNGAPSQAGDSKAAIDCCVLLNQWDQAVTLAQQHNFPQIEGLLVKYASHLLDKNRCVGGKETLCFQMPCSIFALT